MKSTASPKSNALQIPPRCCTSKYTSQSWILTHTLYNLGSFLYLMIMIQLQSCRTEVSNESTRKRSGIQNEWKCKEAQGHWKWDAGNILFLNRNANGIF